jgi:hypothetical protein
MTAAYVQKSLMDMVFLFPAAPDGASQHSGRPWHGACDEGGQANERATASHGVGPETINATATKEIIMKRFINNTKLAAGSFPTTLKKALLPAIALGILLLAGGATSAHAGEYSISKTVDSTTTTSLMPFDRLVESELTEDICSMISPKKKLVKNARESVRSDLSSQCSGMPRGCAVACSLLPNPDSVPMKARYQLLSDSAEVFVGRVRGYRKQCGKRPVLYPRVEVDAFGEGVCGCTCTYTISVDAYKSSAVVGNSELTPEARGGIAVGNPGDTIFDDDTATFEMAPIDGTPRLQQPVLTSYIIGDLPVSVWNGGRW